MPTPESEMFKAAKPTVPPTFDGVDYDDNKALKAAQDSVIREQWVQSMMARLVREELGKCYYREGVNHLEKCGHLRGKKQREKGRKKNPKLVHEAEESHWWCFDGGSSDDVMSVLIIYAHRSLPGAAQALEGQGLPLPAAELHPEGVDLAAERRQTRLGERDEPA